jgi:hypothetical protein
MRAFSRKSFEPKTALPGGWGVGPTPGRRRSFDPFFRIQTVSNSKIFFLILKLFYFSHFGHKFDKLA